MNIVSMDGARVTMLFPFEEIGPLGGADGRLIVARAVEKYEFARPPDLSVSREQLDKSGLKFETGHFQFEGETVPITDFSVYNDGIVVGAHSTERGEALLQDVLAWLRSEFKFREFISTPKTHYLSQVVVDFERPLSRLLAPHEAIVNLISTYVGPIFHTKEVMGLSRMDFEFDKTTGPQAPRFILERRAGIPFAQERYFSGAPMKTADHIVALQEIERLLVSLA